MDVVFDLARRSNAWDGVKPLIAAALERNPRSVAHLNYRSFVLESEGDLPQAERVLREALDVEPDDSATRSNLGRVLLRQGRYAEAVDHLQRAAELSPSSVSARRALAEARRLAGLDAPAGGDD